jgi:hypothetical protein
MASPTIAKGYSTVIGWKKNTNVWGSGLPVACGANDGIEIQSESLVANRELIENTQVSGNAVQLPGVKGKVLHQGALEMDFYYQGCETLLAPAFGNIAAPVQQGGTAAYLHVYKIAENHQGIEGTLVLDNDVAIREYPHVKVGGFTLDIEETQMGKLSFPLIPFDLNLNQGSAITNRIVVSVTPANITFTIANQPSTPSPISILITDGDASITEFVVTITGTDRDGNVIVEIYRKTVNGLTFTTSNYFRSVTSVVGSGLTGSTAGDTIIVGVTNGVNNATAVASISLPSAGREFVLFQTLSCYIADQSSSLDFTGATPADLIASEFFLRAIKLQLDLGMQPDVTSRFGYRTDEPIKENFAMVTGGLSFSKWTSENHSVYRDYLEAPGKKKMKIECVGPIASTPHAYRATFYLNNVMFRAGSANVPGAGKLPLEMEFKAHRAQAVPTGFPSGYDGAVTMELVNLRTTAAF